MASLTLKQHLQHVKRGRAGHRFQDHYARQRSQPREHGKGRIVRLAVGVAAVIGGAILCVLPGPGLPFVFLGGALLAVDSLPVARVMDALEMFLRKLWRRVRPHWVRLPGWARSAISVAVVAGGIVGSIVFYRLLHA